MVDTDADIGSSGVKQGVDKKNPLPNLQLLRNKHIYNLYSSMNDSQHTYKHNTCTQIKKINKNKTSLMMKNSIQQN